MNHSLRARAFPGILSLAILGGFALVLPQELSMILDYGSPKRALNSLSPSGLKCTARTDSPNTQAPSDAGSW